MAYFILTIFASPHHLHHSFKVLSLSRPMSGVIWLVLFYPRVGLSYHRYGKRRSRRWYQNITQLWFFQLIPRRIIPLFAHTPVLVQSIYDVLSYRTTYANPHGMETRGWEYEIVTISCLQYSLYMTTSLHFSFRRWRTFTFALLHILLPIFFIISYYLPHTHTLSIVSITFRHCYSIIWYHSQVVSASGCDRVWCII